MSSPGLGKGQQQWVPQSDPYASVADLGPSPHTRVVEPPECLVRAVGLMLQHCDVAGE